MNNISNTIIWLASYPRSGNTLLRIILKNCFGLPSFSVYANDLSGNKELEAVVGHIERDAVGQTVTVDIPLPLVKTHRRAEDNYPAIYVIRDGRDVCLSMAKFWPGCSIDDLVEGKHQFGSWSDHVNSWRPWDRQSTLLLRYEDMVNKLPEVLGKIETFLQTPILATNIPSRDVIASIDGRWVKEENAPKMVMSEQNIKRFNELNEDVLNKAHYL